MLSFTSLQYLDLVRQLKRGNYRGIVSNAKPLFIISLISAIENGIVQNNRIFIDDIIPFFKKISIQYNSGATPTPTSYPFYHLHTESFYHLMWVDKAVKIEAPSIKWVKEHIEYAYLDNALWDLLQDKETRDYFRQSIEDYYLK